MCIRDRIRIKVRELCSKAYLTPRLELFVQTLDGLRNYKELLASLQVLWGNYQNGLRFVESQEAYLAVSYTHLNLSFMCVYYGFYYAKFDICSFIAVNKNSESRRHLCIK